MPSLQKPILFGAVFILLALALWNPLLQLRDNRVDLILLLDDSASMARSVSDFDWGNIQHLITSLPEGSHFSLLRFAENSALEIPPTRLDDSFQQHVTNLEAPPRQLPLNRNGSNLASALQHALRLQPDVANPIILLVSDGGETQGDSSAMLQQAHQAQINVYGLMPHLGESVSDIAIDSVNLPTLARHHDRIPVTIKLSSTHQAAASLSISLNKRVIAMDELTLSPAEMNLRRYWLRLERPGLNRLEIKVDSALDDIPQNNHYETLINSEGVLPIVYVTTALATPEFAKRIKLSGLPLELVHPSRLQQQLESDATIATVILDNISYHDIREEGWQRLEYLVRNQGTGLLVLGGSRSFAEGSYRHTRLEELLPVISEARQPEEIIAVQFVVDKSGSMSRDANNTNRMAYARKAVIETTRTLTPEDLIGLIAFDAKPQEVLKLGKHRLNIPAIESHWRFQASGGTKLSPALELGIERLASVEANKHLLVVVTDGFVGEDTWDTIESQLREHKIDLIALAVGNDIETETLQRLASINDGRFVHVQQQVRLPHLMRQQVEQVIKSVNLEPSATHIRKQVTFMPEVTHWPPVRGYMVTRARENSTLFLQSDAGHPLFAAHNVGAARVAVLPAGFQQWSDAWLRWPLWGKFAGGLLQWLTINYNAPELYADIIKHSDRLELQLDALDKKGGWNDNAETTLQLTDPDHNITSHILTTIAPGRYSAIIPTPKAGHYHMSINNGDKVIQRDYLRNNNREFSAVSKGQQLFKQWQQQGLITNWTSLPDAIRLGATVRHVDSRPYFLLAAVLGYLAFMFFEYRGRYNLPLAKQSKLKGEQDVRKQQSAAH